MIKRPPYKHRTIAQLNNVLRATLNKLEMRDWQVDIETGSVPPLDFKDMPEADGAAFCRFEYAHHYAYIWIDPTRAKVINADPVWLLLHEVGHIFHDIHDEETRCNIIAKLIY
jgi:hypothetical protein